MAVKKKTKAKGRGKVAKRPMRAADALQLNKLWHKLTQPQRRRRTNLGFDEHTWNNNVRERVQINQYDLIHTGASSSPVVIAHMVRRSSRRPTKMIEDHDATLKAVFND
jgi:hypothetical protein